MPNIKSSVKSIKKDEKRRARNIFEKVRIKKAQKKVLAAIAGNDAAEAKTQLSLAAKYIDMAVANNTIHRNTAARKKSKLAKKVNAIGA
ncbi:MAG: 30S ribosomal protein S20 [Selenomonadaceae bacterium]|nr:30S ribosomal protein S20 [Selenomonadaceae bacterium]